MPSSAVTAEQNDIIRELVGQFSQKQIYAHRTAVTKEKQEGRSGRRAEGFQKFIAAKETTTLKLWKKSRKGWLGNPPFHKRVLEESNLKRCVVPGKILDTSVFLGFQEAPVLLFSADGDTLPQFRPSIHKLRDHMSDLNKQIVVFHGLTITTEEMRQIETMVLLGVEALILNGPSSSAINQ